MINNFYCALLLLLAILNPGSVTAQQESNPFAGRMALVGRMDSTSVKFIRDDKPVKLRMTDGRRLEGRWHLSDTETIVVGEHPVPMKDIYSISGYVARNTEEKFLGSGLIILSALAAVYPAYLIFSGFALGQPQAIFVGAAVIILDTFLAYAGASLMSIYPRKFNRLNWDIRIDYPRNMVYTLPGELPLSPSD